MIPALLDCLRSGEPSFHRESLEWTFRRTLLEILHRITLIEVRREQVQPFIASMLHLLRVDNEDNGVLCCKTIIDLVRTYRTFNEELLKQFVQILNESFANMPGLIEETLSEESALVDPTIAFASMRSFKVMSELAMVIVHLVQFLRTMVQPVLFDNLESHFNFLNLESPAQKKAREDFEAMGGYWSGMAPTIRNSTVYADFILAQVKVRPVMRRVWAAHSSCDRFSRSSPTSCEGKRSNTTHNSSSCSSTSCACCRTALQPQSALVRCVSRSASHREISDACLGYHDGLPSHGHCATAARPLVTD